MSKNLKKELTQKEKLFKFFNENFKFIIVCLILVIFIVNIIFLSKRHEVKLKDGNEIISSLKDKDITAEELFQELKKLHGASTLVSMVDEYIINTQIENSEDANKYANEQLSQLKTYYESMGYTFNDILTQYGYENEDDLINELIVEFKKSELVKNYLKDEIKDSEINDYYENTMTDKYSAKHILIKVASTASDDEKQTALKEAEEVIEKLNNGEDWKELVNKYSDDTGSIANEGLIENFMASDVVDEFYEATSELEDNEYTKKPVLSPYGYHIIYRVSKQEKGSLEEEKETILEKIVTSKLNEDPSLADSTMKNIRKKYNFTINDTEIDKQYNKN